MPMRILDGFFYGLFMDPDILSKSGVQARNPRRAYTENYQLIIGKRATLWPVDGARAYGVIYSMTHQEIEKLYAGAGLTEYKPEALLTVTLDNEISNACLCYNLVSKPEEDERNAGYSEELKQTLARLEFPGPYIESVK